jgi:hypothetical protein
MTMLWNLAGQFNATCLYGEITVLATSPCIYFCGANWHPGEPAGGYCGIQHHDQMGQPTIFSIWDTTPAEHSKTTAADPATIHRRFGNEGEGEQTFLERAWSVGELFRFFVSKEPGKHPDSTDTRYYVFDPNRSAWRHVATITNPNAGHKCVTTLTGSLNSFLENWAGRDKSVPKLALYRLWLGTNVDGMTCLTSATGNENWGVFGDAFFLAEGDHAALGAVFAQWRERFGTPVFGGRGESLSPISNKPVPSEVALGLRSLPVARSFE